MSMEPTLITVHGKTFVAGLFWKPLHNPRNYMAEAKKIGRDEGWDMVTIRKGRTAMQAGFMPKNRRKLKNAYSLAATLAGELGDNWLGVFELDDGRYAFVAVNDGMILPGRDVVGDFPTIEGMLRENYSLVTSDSPHFAENGKIYAPAEFNFGDEHPRLTDVIPAKKLKPEYRLKLLTLGLTKGEIAAIAFVITTLAAVGLGAKMWMDEQRLQRDQEAAAASELQRALAEAKAATDIVRPWIGAVGVDAMLASCAAFLADTPLALGGWHFASANCAPGQGIATYQRLDASPVDVFTGAATAFNGQPPAIFEAGQAGSIEARFNAAPAGDEELPVTSSALTALTAHIQRLGGVATLTIAAKPHEPDPANPKAPAPDWTTNVFTIQTTFPPELLMQGLSTDGMRISQVSTSLNHDEARLSWLVSGEIYGR